jgi:hypothetical protein
LLERLMELGFPFFEGRTAEPVEFDDHGMEGEKKGGDRGEAGGAVPAVVRQLLCGSGCQVL